MKLIRISLLPLAAILALSCLALSQEGALTTDPPKGTTPQDIIQKFAAKEKEFKQARDLYTFRQDVRVQPHVVVTSARPVELGAHRRVQQLQLVAGVALREHATKGDLHKPAEHGQPRMRERIDAIRPYVGRSARV